jgi:hypothetical protein
MEQFMHADFWIAVGQIIMIDILLGGDNAVVIALACRKLPPAQRTQGILWGTVGAILLRVVLIFFALTLLRFRSSSSSAPSCWCGSASSCWRPATKTATVIEGSATSCGRPCAP